MLTPEKIKAFNQITGVQVPTDGSPMVTPRSQQIREIAARAREQQAQKENEPSLLRKIGGALISNEKRFGESLAAAGSQFLPGPLTGKTALEEAQKAKEQGIKTALQGLDNAKKQGGDTGKWLKILSEQTGQKIDTMEDLYPALNKSNKQVLGEALGVFADIASAGSYGKGFTTGGIGLKNTVPSLLGGTAPTSFVKGALKGGLVGAGSGAASGGVQGFARGLQDDKSITGSLVQGGIGSVIGGAAGGVLGATTGGITGYLKGKALRKAELKKLIDSGDLADSRLAKINPETLANDPLAKEAIKQGIGEDYVAPIKAMSATDKNKALKMLQIAERASTNKKVTERPFDVVGQTVLEPAKHLEKVFKQSAGQLDEVAGSLKGKFPSQEFPKLISSIDDDLARIGAKSTDKGINFAGSTLEDVGGNTKIIDNVYRRIADAQDAFDLHKVKKYIDNSVDYGKNAGGLAGEAERMLKGWRRGIDTLLDNQFPEYNKINTIVSQTINQLDELGDVMGTSFKVSKPFAEVKAGQVASRILSNSSNRGDVMRVLNNLQNTAKAYGYNADDDIINQVLFADMLDDVFNTQATRSLQGQTERAISKTVGAGKDLAQGNYLKAVSDTVIGAANSARGINQDAKINSIRALLKSADVDQSVAETVTKAGERTLGNSMEGGYIKNPFAALMGDGDSVTNTIAPSVKIADPKVDTIVSNHISTAKQILSDAIQSGDSLTIGDVLRNTKEEILAGLNQFHGDAKIINAVKNIKIDLGKMQTIDDFGKLISDAINNAASTPASTAAVAKPAIDYRSMQKEVNEYLRDFFKTTPPTSGV